MPVYYDQKTIIPAPFASINNSKNRVGDSRQISNQYSITLTGSILPFFSGIFDSSSENVKGSFINDEALAKILEKQNEVRNLFAEDGKLLEIQGWDGSQPEKFLPIIESIDFGEGNWVNICNYTITMTATRLIGKDGEVPDYSVFTSFDKWRLSSANDNYSMSNNGDGSAEITRSINAKGILAFDENSPGNLYQNLFPWQQASGWCEYTDHQDVDVTYSGVVESCLPGFKVIDTKVSKNVDYLNGDYSIERGWLVSNTGVYIVGKSSTEDEEREKQEQGLNLDFEIQGLGFTSPVQYDNATAYWTERSIDTKDAKIDHIKSEFSDVGADSGGYFFSSFSEAANREGGSIANNLVLTGASGVYHTYTINADTNWIDLPDRSLSVNGSVTGTGDTSILKLGSALDYYQTIDFESLTENVRNIEFGSGDIYLQSQSLGTNNDTGEVTYTRTYTNFDIGYKDVWTVNEEQTEVGGGNTISLDGTITGLASDKNVRWADVYTAFNSIFTSDADIWNNKVVFILGSNAPQFASVTTRTFNYDNIVGTISYAYNWDTVPNSSGEIDYTIDPSYDVATDTWTVTTNGTVRGAGNTSNEKLENALTILPHENEAWQHTYDTVVSKLHLNAQNEDDPKIIALPNQRSLVSRNFSTSETEGLVTFTFTWNTGEDTTGYTVESNNSYSWSEQDATETVSVNGTIKGYKTGDKTKEENLDSGWDFVFNGGDPICPNSVYALRHQSYFPDQANTAEQLPTYYPISSGPTPSAVLSFNRLATLESSSMERNDKTGEISYSFEFAYRAWPYGLPLWFTNVSISFNKTKSIDKWVRKEIIGKRTGPVHQLINSRNATAFAFSVTINTSKRKSDQFGAAIIKLLEEYTEFIMRMTFLDNSGYAEFNYSSDDPNQNCYLSADNFSEDIINGSVTRNATIYMFDILE